MDLIRILDTLGSLFEAFGYPIIFIGSMVEITPLGWAVPGGAILVIAGYLSNGSDTLSLAPIIIWGTFGAWLALLLAYFLGQKSGNWLIKKLNQERNAEIAKRMLKNNGAAILTTSMMANLTRFWISYIAGVEKYNFLKFNIFAYIASLTWVSLMVILGFFAGFEKENLRKIINSIGVFAWIFLLIAIIVIFKSIKHEFKHFSEDTIDQENSKK